MRAFITFEPVATVFASRLRDGACRHIAKFKGSPFELIPAKNTYVDQIRIYLIHLMIYGLNNWYSCLASVL